MPTTYRVSITENGILNINGIAFPNSFKNGYDGESQITFDSNFWKQCFIGDSNKDGCPLKILDEFLSLDYRGGVGLTNRKSAEDIKKVSSDMTDSLIDNQTVFRGEIIRAKKYKTTFPEHLKTQFDSAFPECDRVYVNKDCGLDPAVFMVAGKCFKSCNVASDVIDPHSSKTGDCFIRFPNINDTLELDDLVFKYLGYPRTCRLAATTRNGGGNYALAFSIKDDTNDTFSLITPEYFLGNKTKKTMLISGNNENNAKLCIAKYSGDTLQSLIQRVFQLISIRLNIVPNTHEFVVSTCDSIVALRSYALNGSYIEITDDETKEKITQVFIRRPNFANQNTLLSIFIAEREKVAREYTDFEALIQDIIDKQPGQNFNNIYICGSNTTYKFSNNFYILILQDIRRIRIAILGIQFNANNQGGISIRTLRTFKINDFLKTNGPDGEYYCITLAAKYTKGNLGNIGIAEDALFVKVDGKKTSTSFFEFATSRYNVSLRRGGNIRGGVNPANIVRLPDPMDLDSMLNYYFDMDFYKHNKLIVKTMFKDGDADGDAERSNKNIDLHKQFHDDFKTEFEKKVSPSNVNYKLLFFDCFSDVINSFGILDIKKPKLRYYSEDAIRYLIDRYLIILKKRTTNSEQQYIIKLKHKEVSNIETGKQWVNRMRERGRSRGRSSSRSKSPDKKNNPRRERSRSQSREEREEREKRAAREKNNYNRGRSRERGRSRGRGIFGRSGGSKTRKIRR